jgi:hypothetical protein
MNAIWDGNEGRRKKEDWTMKIRRREEGKGRDAGLIGRGGFVLANWGKGRKTKAIWNGMDYLN